MANFELTKAADQDLTEIYLWSYRYFGEPKARPKASGEFTHQIP
jgi:hypothetical protein